MSIDLDAIRKRAERYARAMGPGGEKAWIAGLLAGDVPALLAEIARLTDSEDSRVVVLEAERDRFKAWNQEARTMLAGDQARIAGMQARLRQSDNLIAELRANAERAEPVLNAAQAWHQAMLESSAVGIQSQDLGSWRASEELCAAVDEFDRCPSCGPGGCAGHTRKPSEAGGCVCSFTNHDYNGTTVKELNPDADCPIHGEVVCPRCGGRDGTHTFRDCKTAARYPHAKCADEEPHNSHVWGDPEHWCAGTWTTTAVVAETALLRRELGLSSTDTTGAGAADV